MDPVAVVAGVIKAGFPDADMQLCAKVAWNVVTAINGLGTIQTKETTPVPATEGK